MSDIRIIGQVSELGQSPFQRIGNLSPDEQAHYGHLLRAVGHATLDGKNPFWDDEAELALKRSLSFVGGGIPTANGNINDRFSKRHPVSDLNIPRDPVAVIQTALRYSYENPFVAKALRVKTNFTAKNMRVQTTNVTVREFYRDEMIRLGLYVRIREILWMMVGVGVCPIYWGGEETGRVDFLEILDPRMCRIERIMGKTFLYLKVDNHMREAVQDPEGKKDIRNRARYQALPKYWIAQIQESIRGRKPDIWIELQQGSFCVVNNRYSPIDRARNQMDGCPLQPAFDACQRYRLLAAGDFAVAWNVKNMITLISEGDPKADTKSYAPADDLRLAKLEAKFTSPDYAFTVFCDPTTLVRYIIPPIEVFAPEKYSQTEKEIKESLGLPSFMWLSDGGGTFGAASQELKELREEIDALRVLVREDFLRPLFSKLRSGARRPGFAESAIILPTFDRNSLRDDAIWLDAMQQAYGAGASSLASYQESLDLDHEYETKELAREHKDLGTNLKDRANPTTAQPLFENSQGNQEKPEPPGPPGSPGSKSTSDGSKPRAPRASGK